MDESAKTTPNKLEQLFAGYGQFTPVEFVDKLVSGELEVWQLPRKCYALVKPQGHLLELLTCCGSIEGSEDALIGLERLAIARGFTEIKGYARYGWKSLLDGLSYETGTKLLFFRKQLI